MLAFCNKTKHLKTDCAYTTHQHIRNIVNSGTTYIIVSSSHCEKTKISTMNVVYFISMPLCIHILISPHIKFKRHSIACFSLCFILFLCVSNDWINNLRIHVSTYVCVFRHWMDNVHNVAVMPVVLPYHHGVGVVLFHQLVPLCHTLVNVWKLVEHWPLQR